MSSAPLLTMPGLQSAHPPGVQPIDDSILVNMYVCLRCRRRRECCNRAATVSAMYGSLALHAARKLAVDDVSLRFCVHSSVFRLFPDTRRNLKMDEQIIMKERPSL